MCVIAENKQHMTIDDDHLDFIAVRFCKAELTQENKLSE